METKLLELKHLLDQKNCQMKNHPKLRNFSQLRKLANKNHLSSNNLSVKIYQKILIRGTCHILELITVTLGLLKIFHFRETITHSRAISFSQSPKFRLFSSPILDGFCVSVNVRHFFMWKQFMCADCSKIILHKRAIRWILVASQAEIRKDEWVPEVLAYEWNLIVINYWREIL